jgi:hypothetical protein
MLLVLKTLVIVAAVVMVAATAEYLKQSLGQVTLLQEVASLDTGL